VVTSAKQALQQYADPDFLKYLDETGQGNDPRMIRIFAKIGKELGAGGGERLKGAALQGATVADVSNAIATFRTKHNKVLFDKAHPDHDRKVSELQALYEAKFAQ
jgi:hypothetical protein